MGREVRRVPANWEHPKDTEGDLIPLHDGYTRRVTEWDLENAKWQEGLCSDKGGWQPIGEDYRNMSYAGYAGARPKRKDHMPEWPTEERTHYQMYETCTEGTPISPVMQSPTELARWLVDNNASAFGGQTATYEQWLGMISEGSAPSAMMVGGVMQSGVAFVGQHAHSRENEWPDVIG